MKEKEEGWTRLMQVALITYSHDESNKSKKIIKMSTSSNIHDGSSEDDDIENVECEEELIEQRKNSENKFLCRAENEKEKIKKRKKGKKSIVRMKVQTNHLKKILLRPERAKMY